MAVNHKRIKEMLGEREEQSDNSLRGSALRRALNETVPRTMTPFEWEQWYRENGVPEEHRQVQGRATETTRWARVKRIFRLGKG